jgi:fatty acid desaturase
LNHLTTGGDKGIQPAADRRGGRIAEERSAEIESLRRQQAAQRNSVSASALPTTAWPYLLAVAVIKIAITGNDPPPTMTFIVMTYIFPASF